MKNKINQAFDKIKADEQLKENTYQLLQEKLTEKPGKKKTPVKRFALAIAAIILLATGSFYSYNMYTTEAAYLDIDVNPSIELTLNRFDQVINAYAYNKEGQEILDNIDITNKSYKNALTELVTEMTAQGYITDTGLFTATLQTSDNKTEKEKIKKMQTTITQLLKGQKNTPEQKIYTVDATTKTHAHEENLTPAKYLAILKLQEVDPEATFDNCRHHSISEIEEQCDSKHVDGDSSHSHGEDSGTNHHSEGGNNKNHHSSSEHNKHKNDSEHKKHSVNHEHSKSH